MGCEHDECHKMRDYLREVRKVACFTDEPGSGWGRILTHVPAIIHEETFYLDIDKIASLDYRGEKLNLNELGVK